ncbi:hypothetical protein [Pseudoduganella violaceinigra]|uniref:hypothetical protein n=1 Tax=Pseudoduganella violaceinigra TaxID=246602 RepID=UPI000485ECCA|nr:hypothetical protein [Pseudoduganella violaceinigra]
MTHIEILDGSDALPFQIPAGRGNHAGVPASVSKLVAEAKPSQLVAWKDSISNTIGFARNTRTIVIDAGSVDGLAICFMRKAKGTGFVSLEAKLQDIPTPLLLFEIGQFDAPGLQWLSERAGQFEKMFGVPVKIEDYGYDC